MAILAAKKMSKPFKQIDVLVPLRADQWLEKEMILNCQVCCIVSIKVFESTCVLKQENAGLWLLSVLESMSARFGKLD
jgi:hypothetical protein